MKIILTGSTGFVGSNFLQMYKKSYDYFLLVRDASKVPQDISRLENIKIFEADLSKQAQVQNFFENLKEKIDCAVHLAGEMDNTKLCNLHNAESTKNIVNCAKAAGIKKIVFLSTDNVYCDYDFFYGPSKLKAEEYIKTMPNFTIFRPTVIFGENNKRFLKKIEKMADTWPVILLPGNGKHIIQPIFVKDVCKFVNKAIKENINGTFDLAGPEEISINQFIKKIMSIKNKNKKIIHTPYSIALALVKLFSLARLPTKINIVQLKSLNKSRTYDLTKLNNCFGIKQETLDTALKQSINTANI